MTARREELCAIGRHYYRQGWLFGTSGNLSARLSSDTFVVTASGRDKGQLTVDDFVIASVDDGGRAVDAKGPRASAESSLHAALYDRDATIGWVLHTHTVASALLAPTATHNGVEHTEFQSLEMIKGYGLWTEGAIAALPVFPNHGDVRKIADEVSAYYATPRDVPAFVIAGHGITAWGASAADARRHLEVTEFLCQVARAR